MSDKPSDRPSVSDEEWASFVEAAKEQGLGTEAQARALRKAKPPKPPKRPKAPKRQEPAGWRTGPAWQEMNGRAARKRKAKAVLGVALVAALALVAVRPQLVTALLPDDVTSALPSSWTDHPEDTTPLAAETAAPTAPPEPVDPHRPTLKEPFRGSPAVRWADGAAGIELPPAKATGWMSKTQVEAALKKSREFLVAANLDPKVLQGGRPDAALKLIDPTQKGVRTQLEGWLAKPTDANDPKTVFSRFSPVEVKPAGTVVKVRGRMSVAAGKGKKAGTVEVSADYTFVYPLLKAGPGADEVARTIVRREMTFVFYDPARYQVSSGKVVIGDWMSDYGNSSCERDGDGFLHPEFESDLRTGPVPGTTGPATDPYDRSKPIDRHRTAGCGTVTRS
ncbi:hypothetical protein KV205_11360 [Streptomyces sp. SKN60]|uniref:hypothetical protein n=1 Tax=Streptomyces sp. SKN60 TaxID=2855506 RepID=UPI002247FE66|nr:hypothetical protein [Streptomyces sp. SKN60]MCX2181125.1 hypothetical protein [Streptomyces sp. SKN60]